MDRRYSQHEVSAEEVDNILPQTQCTKCGYPSCMSYAQAIVDDGVLINRCPPGGDRTIRDLATLLKVPTLPLDQTCGFPPPPQHAFIEEKHCIGCTLCIKACPVDAIIGAAKQMHTVTAKDCTGCELCIPACPVDCIVLIPDVHSSLLNDGRSSVQIDRAALARNRFNKKLQRLREARNMSKLIKSRIERQKEIMASVERTRQRRHYTSNPD